ncbi:MAG: hypothetical protein AAGA61_07010 [Pseudomonadota bacterium]
MNSSQEEQEFIDQDVVDIEDDDEEDVGEQTIVMTETDEFTDPGNSMEVNVEKLVAEVEKAKAGETNKRAEVRRKLEQMADDGGFEDTYAIEFDD